VRPGGNPQDREAPAQHRLDRLVEPHVGLDCVDRLARFSLLPAHRSEPQESVRQLLLRGRERLAAVGRAVGVTEVECAVRITFDAQGAAVDGVVVGSALCRVRDYAAFGTAGVGGGLA
jgi:hypothetical protein